MKVWALFLVKSIYKSNAADMLAAYGEKPTVEQLMRENFSKWEARQLLKGNTVEYRDACYYLEEIDDYETDDQPC